mmetsp:Transcript_5676/g.10679  ORF Transcript_5676/g.10679 Transcript_5676/m.10679 type:complete len:441 (+) Transcript_5676:99-1421(+)
MRNLLAMRRAWQRHQAVAAAAVAAAATAASVLTAAPAVTSSSSSSSSSSRQQRSHVLDKPSSSSNESAVRTPISSSFFHRRDCTVNDGNERANLPRTVLSSLPRGIAESESNSTKQRPQRQLQQQPRQTQQHQNNPPLTLPSFPIKRETSSSSSPSWAWTSRATTQCESPPNDASLETNSNDLSDSPANKPLEVSYYYQLLDPNRTIRTSLVDSHAVFGALCGDGLIERYDVYRRVALRDGDEDDDDFFWDEDEKDDDDGNNNENNNKNNNTTKFSPTSSKHSKHIHRELTVVDLKLGKKLNGHGGIVHGGIISLLFDEAMGWAHECLDDRIALRRARKNGKSGSGDGQNDAPPPPTIVVTANLAVDFRAPFREGSEAVVRVYHDGTEGRKIYFSAVLESLDGRVVFAEAKSLFVRVRLESVMGKKEKKGVEEDMKKEKQ